MKADKPFRLAPSLWSVGLLAILSLRAPAVGAQTCPITNDATITGTVNTYYPGIGTTNAGGTSIQINTTAAAVLGADDPIAIGDLLLVIQMQDADINSSNTAAYGSGLLLVGGDARGQTTVNSSGLYEYVVSQSAAALNSGTVAINITGGGAANGTINAYRTAAKTTLAGQRSFQVIKVARYRNVVLNAVTAAAWNGTAGGVVAIDAAGSVTVGVAGGNGVNVTGLGFRGGTGEQLGGQAGLTGTDLRRTSGAAAHGRKGEGIAGTPSDLTGVGATRGYPTTDPADANGDRARGAPGNAGGGASDANPAANDQNSGGGGGGNGGQGGGGGLSWNTQQAVGGYGGAAFPATLARMAMGGGGGAGSRNNSADAESGGSAGGGIVLIRGNTVAGTGTIIADGAPANTAALTPDRDGGGGGGAGGSILLVAPAGAALASATVFARGGRGSDAWPGQAPNGNPGERHGPGGGGGGGAIFASNAVNVASSVAGGVNGTTTTAADAFGATAGNVGVTSATTTFVSIPGVETCLAVTRSVIAGLRVRDGEVEFGVTSSRNTLGFNVVAETEAGQRTRLNSELLRSPMPDTLGPVLYHVALRGPTPKGIFVEELERGGRLRLLGPYRPGDEGFEEAYQHLEEQAQVSEVRERASSRMILGRTPEWQGAGHAGARRRRSAVLSRGASGIKIEVGRGGVVRVPVEDWPRLLVRGPGRGENLYVTNLGQDVPFAVKDGAIEFRARSLSTDYSGTNPYLVTWGRPPEPRGGLTQSGFPRVPGFERVEKNTLYAAFVAPGADPWIWDFVTEGTSGPLAFDLDRVPSGNATVAVRVGLIGGSDHAHHVTASLDGVLVGELRFKGKKMAALEGRIPLADLRAAGNTLVLDYDAAGTTPDDPGLIFLDVLDIALPAAADPGPAEVLDVTPYAPKVPNFRRADYLIVTHPDFLAAAEKLRALKEEEGLSTVVVDVEQAYDLYSAGVVEPNAVKELIRDAARKTDLKYVLLFGDDSYDPRDFVGVGDRTYVPSLYGWDGVFGRVPSETRFADLDDDGRPDVAIGRLPATTAAQADVLVAKIAREGQVDGPVRHVIAVDESHHADISFRGEGEALQARLPAASVTFADVGAQGVDAARVSLIQGLRAGARTTSYFGHGGFDVWSDQHLLRDSDVASLEGSGTETVLFSWTCETQWYVGPTTTISEQLLLVPDGGAVASLGPGGISDPALQVSLSRRVYDYVLRGASLGEAVRRAKGDALAADPKLDSVVQGFSLLGDPALTPLPGGRRRR